MNGDKVPVVYFDLVIVPEAFGKPRIKIGESGNHAKRRNEHAKSKHGVTFDVQHLCLVRGNRADEQHILKYFAGCKLEGEEETFWPEERLVEYIRWLRDLWYVWVPDDEKCQPIEELDQVDGSEWMPNNERRKKAPPQNGLFSSFGELNLPPREVTVDDYYTNEIIIQAATRAMGGIDLDPASHAVANSVVGSKKFFTIGDNGLLKEWAGRVWLNPPFSQWQDWVPKIVQEWRSNRIEAMCVLCATRTLTAQYFHDMHANCSALCVLRGRLPFWGGRAKPSPDDGHVVFYFGGGKEDFIREFSVIGNVYLSTSEFVR